MSENALSQDVQCPVLKSEPPGPKDPPADSAQKLIEKLAASGQLKAGFLMRVLSQGQVPTCSTSPSARLLGVDLNRFRHAFYDSGARTVALACRAAGIDRSRVPHRLQPVAPGARPERLPGRPGIPRCGHHLQRLHPPDRHATNWTPLRCTSTFPLRPSLAPRQRRVFPIGASRLASYSHLPLLCALSRAGEAPCQGDPMKLHFTAVRPTRPSRACRHACAPWRCRSRRSLRRGGGAGRRRLHAPDPAQPSPPRENRSTA